MAQPKGGTEVKIGPYTADHEAAVVRFNQRLGAGGKGDYRFPETHFSEDYPRMEGRSVWREYFVAVDDEAEVRGGYIIRGQPFWSRTESFEMPFLKLPVAEGAVDPRFSTVGIELLQDVTCREPSVFALGMGGINNPLPKIFSRLGWQVVEVPFFFKIRHGATVFRQLEALRSSRMGKLGTALAAWTGAASLGARILQPPIRLRSSLSYEEVDSFEEIDDQLWHRAKCDYDLIGERSAATLPLLYGPFEGRPKRIRVCRDGEMIGWVIGLVTNMVGHRQFGNLRVATLVDGLCLAKDIADVVAAGTFFLESQDPDLVVSNQLHQTWGKGLVEAGFRNGPSNFACAISPDASKRLIERGGELARAHINRGDGDGPIHL